MVTLVVTQGKGSMDLYAQSLAANLDVPKLYTNIYEEVVERFNIPALSSAAFEAAWQDWRFIRRLNRENSVLHLPNHHLGRYGLFLKVPYIITVHDLIRYFDLKGYGTFIHRPNLRDKFYLSLDSRGIKKAVKIIAVSQATKEDLIKHLGIPQERITVVYEGIDHRLFQPTHRRLVDYPYILFVGSEHPRKNFAGLLRAFSKLKADRRFKDLKLLKVGKAGGAEAEFRKQTLQVVEELALSGEVIFTDHVAAEDLPAYYSGAVCLVLPSLYEGFGFPPLEAMACGCPVIVSNAASLPEIAGEAAIKVAPHDSESLARALEQILTDERLREELRARGFERARQFSWERAAEETKEVYRSVERALSGGYVPAEIARKALASSEANAPLKAVILAGGEGTRLRPLTYYTPKPMVPVLNFPFLEHTLAYLKKYGIGHVILSLGYQPEAIQSYFAASKKRDTLLSYCIEESPLGTAGAVKNAEKYLDQAFVVLNGDIFTDLDLARMLAFHRERGAKATIALTWVDNPCAFGVVETDSDGRVRRFVEKPAPEQVTTHWINAGIYILEPEVLQHIPRGRRYMFERELFPLLLERGELVFGYPFRGYWLDVGTPQKYLQLNCDLLQRKTTSPLLPPLEKDGISQGSEVSIHPTAEIAGPVLLGDNCHIGPRAQIKGPVVIGPACQIEEGAQLEKTVLWRGVKVGNGAKLKQCILSSNTKVADNEEVSSQVITPEHGMMVATKELEKLSLPDRVPTETQ